MTTRLVSTQTEPVTLAEAKAHAGVYVPDFDTLIEDVLIPAARRAAEQHTGRSIAAHTWDLYLDEFPDEIQLPYPPILTVTTFEYVDPDGVTRAVDPGDYVLDAQSEPGWLLPADGVLWPQVADIANAVHVRYTAGYGTDCPADVKLWIFAQVRHFYDNRGAMASGQVAALPYLDSLLDAARVYA